MRVLVASTRALEGAALQGGDESVEVACEAVAERLEGLPTGLPGPAEPAGMPTALSRTTTRRVTTATLRGWRDPARPSATHAITQVEHPTSLDHEFGVVQQVLGVESPEVALAGAEHDGHNVHRDLVD